jgi:hypothetical protein
VTAGRRAVALGALALGVLASGAARPLAGQAAEVEVTRPAAGEELVSATPQFTAVARNLGVPSATVSLELQVSRTPGFEPAAIVFDDTLPGDSVEFVPARPLPSATQLWWRAIARTDGAIVATSATTGPRRAATWLRLVSPDAPNGVLLGQDQPLFTWSAAPIASPPGPWRFDIEIFATSDRILATALTDTTFVPPRRLEANTSYRWTVKAHILGTPDSVRVQSQGSFVITSPDRPLATLLYQNFPNPFPTSFSRTTCIWFDLERATPVLIEILTLRGDRVRQIYPLANDPPLLPPGRHGRGDIGGNTGCDPHFAWDGRSDDGRTVAPGVYLLRLRVGTRWETRKILFRGG